MSRVPFSRAAAALALAWLLASCRSGRVLGPAQASPLAPPPAAALPRPVTPLAPVSAREARDGRVQLSPQDLAGVDAWVAARNAQWIVGDEVLVEGTREYFAPILAIASRVGAVERTDEVTPEVTTVTLRFMMSRSSLAVENNPRVQVGAGLTVSARRVLRLRLVQAHDLRVPVWLRVVAQGDASQGRRDRVERRGATLSLAGALRRTAAGWSWSEQR